jgi:hypothetical protein
MWGSWPAWEVLALVAVTGVGLLLRLHLYTAAPAFTDNADEIQFTWGGLNLLLHHDAYTWSFYPGYPSYHTISAFGQKYPMVHHWMDHPPLFALLMGAWVWLLGARDMLAVTPEQVRLVPVALSTTTIVLVQLLGRRLIGPLAALSGAVLLATAPGAVLLGRQAEPEALQAVLLLLALLLTLRIVQGAGGRWTLAVLLLCCLASPLLKVSGIAIAGICAVILAVYGRWALAGWVFAAGAIGILLFVGYGRVVDWRVFSTIWSVQAGNRIGVMSGFDFITAMAGVNRRLRDGWWILGWIALAGLAVARRGRRWDLFLVWPAAAYATAMLVLAGEKQAEQYGWYRVIIYPEIYLAAGWLAWEAIQRRSLALMTLLVVLGGATATNWWLGGPDDAWVPPPVLLVLLIVAVLAPVVLYRWRRNEPLYGRLVAIVSMTAFGIFVLGNAVESLWLDRIFFRM